MGRLVPIEETLSRLVPDRPAGKCWEWRGKRDSGGYGVLCRNRNGKRCNLTAHRAAYEAWVGPIPEGLVLDHLCRNHACVNPDHLEPVTHRVNCMRGMSPGIAAARLGQCIKGHEFTAENTYRAPTGRRECRRCHADRERRRYWAAKEAS